MKNIKLLNLLSEGEQIATFTTCKAYRSFNSIATNDSDDISAMLGDTLHRILDNGGDADDVYAIMGAMQYKEALEANEDLETYQEYFHIDLGYIIPDLIQSWEV